MSVMLITITGGGDSARKLLAERLEIALLQMLHSVRVTYEDGSTSARWAPQGFDETAEITLKKGG